MAKSNTSYDGASWADQWDYNDDSNPFSRDSKKSGGEKKSGVEKTKEIATAGFEKTKVIATVGFKKAKEGTTHGFQWIKEKCQKKSQKN
ncbi:hypothetical protein LUZ62_068950 [Rhynchospora pubera]|uniref:Uncharacterized protein n=1 Tax=Rhynchospora pubera TaxID=906938 RepID=A0AAV8CSN7_9POAL|nr:hypothetical protein LUZ62_068950 [Rhynchospora pubera]